MLQVMLELIGERCLQASSTRQDIMAPLCSLRTGVLGESGLRSGACQSCNAHGHHDPVCISTNTCATEAVNRRCWRRAARG